MVFKPNFMTRSGMLLMSGLVILSMLLTLNISCQPSPPAPTPTPVPAPTPSEPTSKPAVTEVVIQGFAFVPATITVPVGTTVTWTNQDSVPHTVTSETGLFDSGNLARADSFSYSFIDRGTFSYYCVLHPSMKGKVIVE